MAVFVSQEDPAIPLVTVVNSRQQRTGAVAKARAVVVRMLQEFIETAPSHHLPRREASYPLGRGIPQQNSPVSAHKTDALI
ncbi:MAG TPA: hypothetical protein VMR62_07705, partial [Bryobacteraceae bacterium]|nr:hypothetical protein [Bryobacteraceae bacterium]